MLGGTQQARVRAPRRLINHECVQCLYCPRIRAGGGEEGEEKRSVGSGMEGSLDADETTGKMRGMRAD